MGSVGIPLLQQLIIHLDPRGCVGNDSVVFPPHMRSVGGKNKMKKKELGAGDHQHLSDTHHICIQIVGFF